jgi:hypothetical protein
LKHLAKHFNSSWYYFLVLYLNLKKNLISWKKNFLMRENWKSSTLHMWTGQKWSSLFKTDNGSIAIFYFFLSKVGIDTVSIRYRYSIDTVSVRYRYGIGTVSIQYRDGIDTISIRYRYNTVSIATYQIIVIDSITKKMYEKKVHFYRYRIVINILLTMYGKKVHFYHYRIDIELLSISLSIRYRFYR